MQNMSEYHTEVKWKRSMNIETISSDNVLHIQFNLYMPHQDPKFLKMIPDPPRVLTLRRDELPLIGATCLKRMKMYFLGHWKLKCTKNRIMEVLESIMPLAQEERRTTVAKIFKLLTAIPKDANSIHVEIYDHHVTEPNARPKPAIATRSIMDVNDLEKVILHKSCGICMDEFAKGVIAIRLPCLHIFHGHCIFRWLERNHKCPLCRNPMPHDDADQFSDDTSPSLHVYRRSYYTKIESIRRARSFKLQILFNLYESNQFAVLLENGEVSGTSIDARKIYLKTEPHLLTIPSRYEIPPSMIIQVLNSLCVPRHEQPAIVNKIYERVAYGGGALIKVDIYNETWDLFDLRASIRFRFRIRRRMGIARPLTDARIARELAEEELLLGKPKPANKSAIEGLERVRVDNWCRICMDHFEDGLLATRFPCLHIFHGHCALRWLKTNHKYCPICIYPLLCD